MYKVSDLIKDLQKLDQDLPIILQQDPEGNGYHWVRGAETVAIGEDYDTCRVESVGHYELTPELEEAGYTEDDIYSNPCVVVYP